MSIERIYLAVNSILCGDDLFNQAHFFLHQDHTVAMKVGSSTTQEESATLLVLSWLHRGRMQEIFVSISSQSS